VQESFPLFLIFLMWMACPIMRPQMCAWSDVDGTPISAPSGRAAGERRRRATPDVVMVYGVMVARWCHGLIVQKWINMRLASRRPMVTASRLALHPTPYTLMRCRETVPLRSALSP
jgi:hypothetical protein